jgi:hypothetical protein
MANGLKNSFAPRGHSLAACLRRAARASQHVCAARPQPHSVFSPRDDRFLRMWLLPRSQRK